MTTVTQINTKGASCHWFGSFTCTSRNPFSVPVCLSCQFTWSWVWLSCWWSWRLSVSCSTWSSWGRCSTWRRRSNRTALPFWSMTICPLLRYPRELQPPLRTKPIRLSVPQLWSLPVTTAWSIKCHTHTLKNDDVKAWGNANTTLEQADRKS